MSLGLRFLGIGAPCVWATGLALFVNSLFVSDAVLAADTPPCISEAELDAAVGEQVRAGAFAIDTSKLREAPMCSGLTVAQAIQRIGEGSGSARTNDTSAWPNGGAEIAATSTAETVSTHPTARTGRITGEFGYPSDYIPDDITACAEPLDGGEEFCASRSPGKGAKATYTLKVPPGRYRVYARTTDSPNKNAYYTKSVVCAGGYGGEAHCTDHTPVIIDVAAGATRSGVNPDDWYEH